LAAVSESLLILVSESRQSALTACSTFAGIISGMNTARTFAGVAQGGLVDGMSGLPRAIRRSSEDAEPPNRDPPRIAEAPHDPRAFSDEAIGRHDLSLRGADETECKIREARFTHWQRPRCRWLA
jgi:hypothetical protein